MKKTITLITVMMMIISCFACKPEPSVSPTAEPGKPHEAQNSTQSRTDEPVVTKAPQSNYPEYLGNVFSKWLYDDTDIYINTPSDFSYYESGYTKFYYVQNEKYVSFTGVRKKADWDLMTAHETALEEFKQSAENMSRVYDLKITSEETKKINDIEVYCYEAILERGLHEAEQELYLIGYSFVYLDIPCNITGVVMAESQSEELKAEVRQIVDDMMHTVRDHK